MKQTIRVTHDTHVTDVHIPDDVWRRLIAISMVGTGASTTWTPEEIVQDSDAILQALKEFEAPTVKPWPEDRPKKGAN